MVDALLYEPKCTIYASYFGPSLTYPQNNQHSIYTKKKQEWCMARTWLCNASIFVFISQSTMRTLQHLISSLFNPHSFPFSHLNLVIQFTLPLAKKVKHGAEQHKDNYSLDRRCRTRWSHDGCSFGTHRHQLLHL